MANILDQLYTDDLSPETINALRKGLASGIKTAKVLKGTGTDIAKEIADSADPTHYATAIYTAVRSVWAETDKGSTERKTLTTAWNNQRSAISAALRSNHKLASQWRDINAVASNEKQTMVMPIAEDQARKREDREALEREETEAKARKTERERDTERERINGLDLDSLVSELGSTIAVSGHDPLHVINALRMRFAVETSDKANLN